jgi:hypothetical protein
MMCVVPCNLVSIVHASSTIQDCLSCKHTMISGCRLTKAANLAQGLVKSTRWFGDARVRSCGNNLHRFETAKPVGVFQPTSRSPKESCTETDELLDAIFSRNMPLLSLSHGTSSSSGLSSFMLQTMHLDGDIEDAAPTLEIHAMSRNGRKPKKANKGARPW